MKHILKCPECNKYTMKEQCCTKTIPAKPPKYSPEDKYGGYRRKVKAEKLKQRGLI